MQAHFGFRANPAVLPDGFLNLYAYFTSSIFKGIVFFLLMGYDMPGNSNVSAKP